MLTDERLRELLVILAEGGAELGTSALAMFDERVLLREYYEADRRFFMDEDKESSDRLIAAEHAIVAFDQARARRAKGET